MLLRLRCLRITDGINDENVFIRQWPKESGEEELLQVERKLDNLLYNVDACSGPSLVPAEYWDLDPPSSRAQHAELQKLWLAHVVECLHAQIAMINNFDLELSSDQRLLRVNALIELTVTPQGSSFLHLTNLGASLLPPPKSGLRTVVDIVKKFNTGTGLQSLLQREGGGGGGGLPLGTAASTGSEEGGLLNSGVNVWWRSDHIQDDRPAFFYFDICEVCDLMVVNQKIIKTTVAGCVTLESNMKENRVINFMLLKCSEKLHLSCHPAVTRAAQVEGDWAGSSGDCVDENIQVRAPPQGKTTIITYLADHRSLFLHELPFNLDVSLTREDNDYHLMLTIANKLNHGSLFTNKLKNDGDLIFSSFQVTLRDCAASVSQLNEGTVANSAATDEICWNIPPFHKKDNQSRQAEFVSKIRPTFATLAFTVAKWSLSGVTITGVDSEVTKRGIRHELMVKVKVVI